MSNAAGKSPYYPKRFPSSWMMDGGCVVCPEMPRHDTVEVQTVRQEALTMNNAK
jgi:hypothetical protein